ncbi:hypothetical protein GCM10007359_21790 [Rothia aerolata]|uniref:Uncharacterized protein n=1 Tax=Rothia aerolata TaxID=1812262 RepID=A0A917IXK4_9MICC|nr:hypothetical protein GCM10007359_21790 [Rothia aerolata]
MPGFYRQNVPQMAYIKYFESNFIAPLMPLKKFLYTYTHEKNKILPRKASGSAFTDSSSGI